MSLSLRVHPKAAEELDAAIAWQEQGGGDRGVAFEATFDQVVERCLLWPESGALYELENENVTVRTAAVGRSLFRVVYFIEDDVLWVVAVAHERRRPGYWKSRLATLPKR